MALATRCPACSTVFRISTAQAAAKGGMVRCGQCRNVFNSLDALVRVEDLEVIEEVVVGPEIVQTRTAVGGAAASDGAGDPTPSDLHLDRPDAVPSSAQAAHEPAEALAGSPVPDADDAGKTVVISEWWLPEPVSQRGPSTSAGTTVVEPAVADPRDTAGSMLPDRRFDLRGEPRDFDGTSPVFMRPEPAVAPAHRATRWILAALSLVATLTLLAQVVYLWRDELAARWSPAKPWLTAACVPLHCRIDYPVHPEAITIESASVQVVGSNADLYVMTALLRNHDPVDVRYPHLELVLTDLQDRPILRRALRPEDYLAEAGRSTSSGFAAESELPLRMTFELNGLRFAGYRLNQFYP